MHYHQKREKNVNIAVNNIYYKHNVDNYDQDKLMSIFERVKLKLEIEESEERYDVDVPFELFNKFKRDS
jgi:hypothetical protein